MTRRPLLALAVAVVLSGSSACLPKAKRDTTRFFLLEPESKAPEDLRAPALGVGPVTLPGYLDRSEMVERVAPTEIRIRDGVHWAEPLTDGFSRALRRELSHTLGAPVVTYPWDPEDAPPRSVEITLDRFERQVDGPAELVARYVVRDVASDRALATREVHLSEPVPSLDARDTVASLSRLVTSLAAAIAKDVAR